METIFSIIILIFSVVIHEFSHGYAANKLGDPTARLAGRLTLNPIAHLSLFGSFIFPLITYSLGGFIFGWAKPVPYNPYNIKHRYGDALVSIAGPGSNLLVALIFGLSVRLNLIYNFLPESFISIFVLIVFINIILAVFNLIPVPPLDGSKILFNFLPNEYLYIREFFERYGLFLIFFFIFFLWKLLLPFVYWIFSLITGLSL
ncbi:site-2 protease family protein [Patescibacteria group bacterium]|nr:site-2 protease family protein [Patescibacteria group bacterium]MBU4057803.1 site-2 protease family protein [Patescibacteria group bacterium]MBU4115614.1 site-2 protease family protein [Patescibacteria group bacterium]